MNIVGHSLKDIKASINSFLMNNKDFILKGDIHLDIPENEMSEPYFIQEVEKNNMNTYYFKFDIDDWTPVICYENNKDIGTEIEEYAINYFENNNSASSNDETIYEIMKHFNVKWHFLDCYVGSHIMS